MKAPFKVLYSNDTTNIEQCTSPFNNIRWTHNGPPKPFTARMLEATVDETVGTGIDVHLLQPGGGWVPWWKSKIYPFAEHVKFMKERYGKDPSISGFAQFMANGGDIVQVFVDHCKKRSMKAFISFRMNDSHGHELVHAPPEKIEGWAWHCISPWHVNHPEWRLGQDLNDWNNRVLNWAIPDVPKHKFALIAEIIEQYDIDGFELDFMRNNSFFRLNETPLAERRKIMLNFVRDVRALLDKTSKPGQHRWFSVRIPSRLSRHDEIGVDVKAFEEAGVDMFNLCSSFYTEQQSDIGTIAKMLPSAAVYNECTFAAALAQFFGTYNQACRRVTDEQFYTLGHLAYRRGGTGVSAFNFVYYRQHHDCDEMGPWAEPPFHVFKGLADPAFLARQPQNYFFGRGHLVGPTYQPIAVGSFQQFDLDMAPPTGGWKKGGRLRIQLESGIAGNRIEASMNGIKLAPTNDISEPYPSPYPNCLGTAADQLAWTVPAEILRDGINPVKVTLVSGEKPIYVTYLDLAVS